MSANSAAHFEGSTSFEVESSGSVYVKDGGYIKKAVVGSSSGLDGTSDGAVLTLRDGMIIVNRLTGVGPRKFSLPLPFPGCELKIVCTTEAIAGTSELVAIDLTTGATAFYGQAATTSVNARYIIASSSGTTGSACGCTLVGMTTASWLVENVWPATTALSFQAAT